MTSAVVTWFCRRGAYSRVKKFLELNYGEGIELSVIEFIRESLKGRIRQSDKSLFVIHGLDKLLDPRYSDRQAALSLFREALRKSGRNKIRLVVLDYMTWSARRSNHYLNIEIKYCGKYERVEFKVVRLMIDTMEKLLEHLNVKRGDFAIAMV